MAGPAAIRPNNVVDDILTTGRRETVDSSKSKSTCKSRVVRVE